VWCVNFTVWTTPLLTAHSGSPQKKRKIVLLFGQFYRFRFGLRTERWIGGGVLKWGIPKSPWASISSHDHPWFGWFGVTCCISSHPEVWIIWNVQTNSLILVKIVWAIHLLATLGWLYLYVLICFKIGYLYRIRWFIHLHTKITKKPI